MQDIIMVPARNYESLAIVLLANLIGSCNHRLGRRLAHTALHFSCCLKFKSRALDKKIFWAYIYFFPVCKQRWGNVLLHLKRMLILEADCFVDNQNVICWLLTWFFVFNLEELRLLFTSQIHGGENKLVRKRMNKTSQGDRDHIGIPCWYLQIVTLDMSTHSLMCFYYCTLSLVLLCTFTCALGVWRGGIVQRFWEML